MLRRKRFFKIARIAAMFIIGLVVAFFVALSRVDLETLRSNIVSVLQESAGVPVEIQGDISWKFSLRPKFVLNKVVVKNADWAKNKNGFYAKKIDVNLNLFSLFQDKPSIEKIKIYDGSLFLEKNESGQFSIQSENKQNHKEHENTENTEKAFPFELNFGLGSVELHNFSAGINNMHYFVSDLYITYESKKDVQLYSGWLKSKAKVYPFIISFSKFNDERKVYPVKAAVSTGGDALVANIALEGTSKMPIDFLIKGDIYNISEFGQIFGFDLPYTPVIKTDIAGGMEHNKLIIRKFNLFVNDSDLKISGDFDWSENLPNINANIKSEKLDLIDVFPKTFKSSDKVWVHPNRELNAFKDIPLFGELFSKYNLNINMKIDELNVYRDLDLNNIDSAADLKKSLLKADIKLKIAGGDLHVAVSANANEYGSLNIVGACLAERIYIGEIISQSGYPNVLSDLPVNFEFYLRGDGKNLSELMSTVTGPFSLYSVGPGYAHSDLVSNIYGSDFLTDLRHNVQDLFTTKKKYDQITVSGAAINIKLRNGKVETQNGIAVETNAINMRLVGSADLGKEMIKASLITVPVRGLKFSITGNFVNSISFTGNMAEPDVKINKAAVAGKVASATGLGLLLAPFTGGISLVAGAGFGLLAGDLLENWLSDDHPCKTAMETGTTIKSDDPQWLNMPMPSLVGTLIKQEVE